MEAPTSFLPPLKRLNEYLAQQIHEVLTRLVAIYLPKVRGTAPIDEELDFLQSDDFERSFAIRWLTGFIARGEEWTELYTDEEEPDGSGAPGTNCDSSIGRFQTEFLGDTYGARTTAYDRAAALLGACAGTSASGAISREFKFATSPATSAGDKTHPEDSDSLITISLRDESISTGDHTAVGLQTWGSACILGERIARDPVAFGLPDASSKSVYSSKGARLLELGAGTGLLSLLAGKLVERAGSANENSPNYTIIATDYHPAVITNLRANVQSNFPDAKSHEDSLVDVQSLDWSLYLTGKPTTDLSRAPSTAPTPAVGTPVSESGQKSIEYQTTTTPGIQATSVPEPTMSPPIQTPSLSVASSVSTPAIASTPHTPQTPRTARSPPPNLARAVFSRLIARGLQFEMPGGPPGIDQNPDQTKKSDSYPNSPKMDGDFSAHCFDSAPISISFDPYAPPLDSDIPAIEVAQMIETRKVSPVQASSSLVPQDAPRSELLCAIRQDRTIVSSIDGTGSNNLTPCLDEMSTFCCLDNMDAVFNVGEDQRPTSSQLPITSAEVNPGGDAGSSAYLKASNKVTCLEIDSMVEDDAVGTGTPQFKIAERADGLVHNLSSERQVPHMVRSDARSADPLGELRTPDTIDCEPKMDNKDRIYMRTAHGNKHSDNLSNFIMNDNVNHMGYTRNRQSSNNPTDPPFDQPFDVILGADIVYELSHVTLVRGVVERLLRKPSYRPDSPPAYFHLIMPLRPTHADEANSVDMAFPRAEDITSEGAGGSEVLAIIKTETYARSAGVGRADEVQYVHYCVGWV